jgi:hypothetical protein
MPGFERLNLEYEVLLSNFGTKFNLHRYIEAFTTRLRVAIGGEFLDAIVADLAVQWTESGRGLHSFTFQLNLSRV